MNRFNRICIVGTGTMGSGIVQNCAQVGYSTVMIGRRPESISRAMSDIERRLNSLVGRQLISAQDKVDILGRIETTMDLGAAGSSDLVIEAIVENLEVKLDLFRRLDALCLPQTILASDTATLPIAELAQATGRPDKVVGMHILSPAPLSKVVEVVRSELCSEETIQRARAFCESLGKAAVVVKDSPGFIINRLLAPYMLEAIRMLEQGVASKEDIDTCMQMGCGYPTGPLRLLDLVGLDEFHDLASSLHRLLGDPKYEPPRLLEDMVQKGLLGRKSGQGFYTWR